MTLTDNILLSKIEDIDTAIEDTDSLRDFLIHYWIINEHVYECRGSSMSLLILFSLNYHLFENEQKNSAICKNPPRSVVLPQTHPDLMEPNDLQNQI